MRFLHTIPIFLCCTLLTFVLTLSVDDARAADQSTGRPEHVVLHTEPTGDDPVLRAVGAGYMSPVTEANAPFTHLLLRWEAVEPVSNTLTLEVRASLDGTTWTAWGAVTENPDLWAPEDGDQVRWSQEIYAGDGARFWQVRATFQPTPDDQRPVLRQVDVNTVDARFATTAPPQAQPRSAASASLPRPAVVSRTGWGSPDGEGSRVRPVYYPVNHMVIHHTAGPNSLVSGEQNWGDRVRAIWAFHTYTRGWGDVGYNFLIDPNGVIYEGRSGGDDAVAFHDTANYGSMGVVLIGTYETVAPPARAVSSLVDVLAWKAAQKDIDPLGRSYYYGCDNSRFCSPFNSNAIVNNIAGHRHITPGHTSCPGDKIVDLLPSIRNQVWDRLERGGETTLPDDGDLVIDELETSMARSDANWYAARCGYGDHTYYSYATDTAAESSNQGMWRPNIPDSGMYYIYAHVPQGCGLGDPPYATRSARYQVHSADGVRDVVVDQNTAESWVDLGRYRFDAGSGGFIELSDMTGEPFGQRKVVFFDTLKWVPAQPSASIELTNVAYDRTTVAAGELLKVTFTVRNNGDVPVFGQDPQAGTRPDGAFDNANSYVYDEAECFLGSAGQDYPIYPKRTNRFRVALGPTDNRQQAVTRCVGDSSGYPWRWGINGELAPGQSRDVVGYVRFRTPGTVSLQAGAVQEYVGYDATGIAPTTIMVTPEKLTPAVSSYDERLQPLAYVYRLGDIPDNMLARTQNPLSVTKGAYVGSFPWDGTTLDWGSSGPLDQREMFVVEQTRVFVAPVDGAYTFRTGSDDGSWLWVDGQAVVVNSGLHTERTITGTLDLAAGRHVLSFKYFERTGQATAGYDVQMPGSASFGPLIDGLGGNGQSSSVDMRLGTTFAKLSGLSIAADDLGGSGVDAIRYSWDDERWFEEAGNVLQLGGLVRGSYTLRYQARDNAGNLSAVQELRFAVDPAVVRSRVALPLLQR